MGLILRFFYTPPPSLTGSPIALKRGPAPETGSLQTPSSSGESANLRSLRTSSSAAFATIARQISTADAAAKPLLRDGFRTLIVIPAVQTHPVIARGR